MRYEVRFLPGVREQDIPAAPRSYQEALVMRLREMAQGRDMGDSLQAVPGWEVLESWHRAYVNPPSREQRLQRNHEEGRQSKERMKGGGGYRLVYREMEVRGKPTLLVAAFGRRENFEAYNAAAQRIVKAQEEQRLRQQAAQSAALPRQAARKLPRSAPAPGDAS